MMEQFKIGDWVQVKSNSDATLINSGRAVEFTGKVVGLHPRNGICVHPFDRNPIEGGWYLPEEVKLWEPKEGEWCWSKYDGLVRVIQKEASTNSYIVEPVALTIQRQLYDITGLEPFIGKLPSFLKEQ